MSSPRSGVQEVSHVSPLLCVAYFDEVVSVISSFERLSPLSSMPCHVVLHSLSHQERSLQMVLCVDCNETAGAALQAV